MKIVNVPCLAERTDPAPKTRALPPQPVLILAHRGSQLGVTGAFTPANQAAEEAFPSLPL